MTIMGIAQTGPSPDVRKTDQLLGSPPDIPLLFPALGNTFLNIPLLRLKL
jgi:hypothetical protein